MNRYGIFSLLAGLLIMSIMSAVSVQADISNAAVLYLRIAPGARAAGMGEAYVAITDDATATHWNPAGLGAYPLADAWIESGIPKRFRPLKAIAALKQGGAADYTAYEIWALTPEGLVRFDNKDWFLHEKFSTKTDQTLEKILSSYFNVTDEERRQEMIRRVAADNNRREYTYLEELVSDVSATVPEGYSGMKTLRSLLDSLLIGYNQCRINWDRVSDIERHLRDGMKDSVLAEVEADRISVAVEQARTRFIQEEIVVSYEVAYADEPSTIAALDNNLLVGTNSGLVVFNGNTWQTLRVADGLPSDSVLSIYSVGGRAYIGTAKGPAVFFGRRLAPLESTEQIPSAPVQAIGGNSQNDMWFVIGDDLYHFDGRSWSNNMSYKILLDDTPESIAERFNVYGTSREKEAYLEKFRRANEATGLQGMVDPAGGGADGGENDLMAMVAGGHTGNDTDAASDSTGAPETTDALEPESAASAGSGELPPGNIVQAPYLVGIKGKVSTIFGGPENRVWIGTDYGILYFDGGSWSMPGYRDYRMKEGESFDQAVDVKHHESEADREAYVAALKDINDLGDEPLKAGHSIKMYRNPAAAPVRKILRSGERLFFTTDVGLVDYDGYYWERSNIRGLDRTPTSDAFAIDDELWLVGEDKIVIKANALTQISFMHVKWLPELTDDVYYEFLSFVTSSREWGTFGGNITYISYGKFLRTNEAADTLGSFESFDIAFTGSYGTALTSRLKVGLSAKLLYSKLSDLGAGLEKGKGTSAGFAVDFGMIYLLSHRLTLGMALTNLGPKMAYIDAAQADDLPRNLAAGFAYKLLESDYYWLLVTLETNKILVGVDDGFTEELKQTIMNAGAEFSYANLIAGRVGYIHDEEGDVKTLTLGLGLTLLDRLKFDFSYIPSGSTESLKNTLRYSLSALL